MSELPYSPYLVSEYVSATERITQTMYTESQMRDYGRAEYERALSEAIDIVERHNYGIAPSVILAYLRALAGEKT